MPMADHIVTDQSAAIMAITPKIRQSMPDSEALDPVSGKNHLKEILRPRPVWIAYWIARVKSMAALTSLMTRFCAGEDSWLACSNNLSKNSGSPDIKDRNGRSRRNKNKRCINGDNSEDTAVNAGFRGSKPGQRKKPFKRTTPGPSNLDRILVRLCQIHGTPEKPANHTNRDYWVFKQAGKLIAENKYKGPHSDDEEEPR